MKKIWGITGIIIVLDQCIKYLFTTSITFGESIQLIPQFFSFTLVKNTGVAFSLFAGSQIPIIVVSIVILYLLFIWVLKQKKDRWNILSFGLLFGGIIGNLLDRIFRAGVIDYLDFNLFGYDFPIFNLADIAVVIGACFLILIMWKEERTCKSML